MRSLKSFSPDHLKNDAVKSGFFHCQKCRLVWLGQPEITECPDGPHGPPVHIAVLCRYCDSVVSIDHLAEHLTCPEHIDCIKMHNSIESPPK